MEIHLKSGTIFTTKDMVVEPLAELILGEASQTNRDSIESLREAVTLIDSDVINHRDKLLVVDSRLNNLVDSFIQFRDATVEHIQHSEE